MSSDELRAAAEHLEGAAAEDEMWASACDGLHWEWRGNDRDELVTPAPMLAEYIDEGADVSLRSVERFPYENIDGEGPRFLISSAEETQATAAGHIIRHDPARVMADCATLRAVAALLRAFANEGIIYSAPGQLKQVSTYQAALAVARVVGVPVNEPKGQP